MSELLRLLKTNERHEQIAQVAHDKRATVSDSLRSLMINELRSDLLKKFWLKKSKILFFNMFYIRFFFMSSFPLF